MHVDLVLYYHIFLTLTSLYSEKCFTLDEWIKQRPIEAIIVGLQYGKI